MAFYMILRGHQIKISFKILLGIEVVVTNQLLPLGVCIQLVRFFLCQELNKPTKPIKPNKLS